MSTREYLEKHTSQRERFVFVALLLGGALCLASCSGDDNPEPTPIVNVGGSGGGGTGGTGGSAGASGGSGGSGAEDSGTGGEAGDGGCPQDPTGCWPCPVNTEQFLNQCTTSQCSKFDNAVKLPLYNNGNLPPIP